MQFNALVEEWPGESIVFFRELPGCFASAPTTEAAIQAAPTAIERYFRWLKANDLVLIEEEIDPINVVLTEQLKSLDNSIGPLFEADRAQPTELEINNALNVAATARALIIEVVANVPEQLFDQAITPGSWSLSQHLQHVMENENWYVSRLQTSPTLAPATREMSVDALILKVFDDAMDNEILLRELTPEQRARVFVHANEEWTSAKVLRRQTKHLYEHLLCMSEIEVQLTSRR